MLAHPELVDGEIRRTIQDQLIAIYYSWVIERIESLQLAIAFDKIGKIRRMGIGYQVILSTLLSRAGRMLLRTLRLRAGSRQNCPARGDTE
jgi:predicted transporter